MATSPGLRIFGQVFFPSPMREKVHECAAAFATASMPTALAYRKTSSHPDLLTAMRGIYKEP
ncbi:hypothetical protein GGD63_002644 [Bradyrhizobium sp. cir1]|nr:hypothetical protein [Bradyrhizobium sp. cir1]